MKYQARFPMKVQAVQFVTNNDDGSNIRAVVAQVNTWVGSYTDPVNPASHDGTCVYVVNKQWDRLVRETAQVGSWVLVDGFGRAWVLTDDEFQHKFEALGGDVG